MRRLVMKRVMSTVAAGLGVALALPLLLAATGPWAPGAGAASQTTARPALVVPTAWSTVTTPATDPTTFTFLNGVSCVGPMFCMAAGQTQVNGNNAPLVERYNGSTWSIMTVPMPSGGNGAYFTGVSCTGPAFCAAVGVQYPGTFQQNFAEVWNGTAWSVSTTPDRSTSANGLLSGVSCVSPTYCLAVGGDGAHGTGETVIERWDGASWTLVPDAQSSLQPELSGVSCLSTSFCAAVGTSFAGTEVPFTEFWDGTSWTVAPTPSVSGATQTLFSTVSCALPTMCEAAGYQDNGSSSGNLVEQWNGSVWALQSAPDPQPPALGSPASVDCFGPTSCALGGQAERGLGTGPTMLLTFNGTAWSLGATPQPGNQSALSDSIHGVSCVAGFFCVAVGEEDDAGGIPQPMVLTSPVTRPGYDEVASDGGIFTFGSTGFFGSTGALTLNKPVVGMAQTPDGGGYWLVASDGGIFTLGDAHFYGSTGAIALNRPIVGMAATPDGGGYWLVASDGGIFTFGDAAFLGSTGAIRLNQPIVGMAATPDGRGYWLVASDGGIFTFGDAAFLGSTGAIRLNQPVVGMAATPDGRGYWLVASDGGIFTFGDAAFLGSTGAIRLNQPVVGMAATPDGRGYWLVASDGGIFAFGDAPFLGSMGAVRLNRPVVGIGA